MTPAEKLQAAIDKLERLKAASTPGPLYAQNAGDVFTDLGAPNAQGVNAEHNDAWHVASFMSGNIIMPYREEEANRALFLALHGTIDAQLSVLAYGATVVGEVPAPILVLADAILGGDND